MPIDPREEKKREQRKRDNIRLRQDHDRYKAALMEIARIGNKLDIEIAQAALSPRGDGDLDAVIGKTGGLYDGNE